MTALRVPVGIDRSSPIPLYHQLAEQLTAKITDGTLQPGDPFENELALAERLQLSRPTVRRAIQELVDQGLLVRRRGLGTTVANRKVHRKFELSSLFDDLERDGRKPTTEVLVHELAENDIAAMALDLPVDTPLLHVERVRSAEGTPLALMHNWLPPAYSDLTLEELRAKGLYAVLRERGVRPVVAQQTIAARMPTTAERRALGMKAGQPVLTMARMAFDAAGNAVEYGSHCYRAADYSINLMVDER